MTIPSFPEFASIDLNHIEVLHSLLSLAPDGVSEFSFTGLYLFRKRYNYRVSKFGNNSIIISGVQPSPEGKSFFMIPYSAPGRGILEELFKTHHYWKNIPDSIYLPNAAQFEEWGIEITEDRDNFDYLYFRKDLAELNGKKYHKKRNLIAQFNSSYRCVEKTFSPKRIPDALEVLERWKIDKGEVGDYHASLEALEHFEKLKLYGSIYYIEGKAAAWCLGEGIARDSIFTIHFEKALDKYKGIYQYMNKAFAATLPENYIHINREQDLGDEGLRQAKMSYRPSGFVKKYVGTISPHP